MTTMLTGVEQLLITKGECYDPKYPEHRRALQHLTELGYAYKKPGKCLASTKAGDEALKNQPPPLIPQSYYVVMIETRNPTPDGRSDQWNKQPVIKAGKVLYCDRHGDLSRYNSSYYEAVGSELYCALRENLGSYQMGLAEQARVLLGENICYQHSEPTLVGETLELLMRRGKLTMEDLKKARQDLDDADQEIDSGEDSPAAVLSHVLHKDRPACQPGPAYEPT